MSEDMWLHRRISAVRNLIAPGSVGWYFLHERAAIVGLAFIVIVVLCGLMAPLLTPYAREGFGAPNLAAAFQPPTFAHPFGTDELGRDQLARILFGARTSLTLGFIVIAIAVVIGAALGAIAGYAGGWVDEAIMRLTDTVLSFPPLLLAVALTAVLRPSLESAILAISITWWPWYARLVRAQAASIRERHYVLASRSMGASWFWVLRNHILPNVAGPLRIQATLDLGAAILTGASLSFLGLGTQPPTADWGVMVSVGRIYLLSGEWWLSVFPGLAICLVVLAFNLLGDGIHTATDPRLRTAR